MLTSDDQEAVSIFIEYSDIIAPNLTIPNDFTLDTNAIDKTVFKALYKYHKHFSILTI